MKVVAAVILGLIFSGGIDLDDIKFRRSIIRLKKEKWFKELSDDGCYYESIYKNEEFKNYVTKNGMVEKVIHDLEERERFLSFIRRSF